MQLNNLTAAAAYMPSEVSRSRSTLQGEQLTSSFELVEPSTAAVAADHSALRQTRLSPQERQAELKDKFQDFVGQTFFSELIKSLRSSQKGAAYFNGGRAEQIFQGQFDQMMSEHLSDATAATISDPMFELFQLGRASG